MNKRTVLLAGLAALLFATGCSTTTSGSGSSDPVAKRRSIDTSVDAALSKESLNKSTDHAARSLNRARSEHDGADQFFGR